MKKIFGSLMAVAVIAGFGATASFAREGDPIPGIDVSIEQSPGGKMVTQNDCKTQGGTLAQHSDGKWYCDMPLQRRGHGVAVGRQGGSFSAVQGGSDQPGTSRHPIAKQTGELSAVGEQGDATPCRGNNYNSSKSNTAGIIKTSPSDDCSQVRGGFSTPMTPKTAESPLEKPKE